jgi:hypothetical protein
VVGASPPDVPFSGGRRACPFAFNRAADKLVTAVRLHGPEGIRFMQIELTSLAGELLIRLAETRGEQPKKTLAWLRSTPWTAGMVGGIRRDGDS